MNKEAANGSISLVLSAIKSGLLSKSIDSVLWCGKVLCKIGEGLRNRGEKISFFTWQWFSCDDGMENCLAACKRFGAYVKPVIVDVIGIYSAGNLFDLLICGL